jgi:DNA-directed RNA polymerase beta subunit
MGRTLCVAVMPYKGYNFEDGVVINERLINEDKLTSVHGIEVEMLISEKDRLLYISRMGTMTHKGEPLLRKTAGELEQLLGYSEGDEDEYEEIHGGQVDLKSPGGIIVDIQVYSNLPSSKFPMLKELIDRTNKKHERISEEKFTVRHKSIAGVLVKFKIQQELRVGLGDKLANRHGNKGIISLIEKDGDMPKTPWGDSIDMILNPVGIIGRMNLGQLYEIYIGLIAKNLAVKMVQTNDQKKVADGLRKILPLLDNTKNKMYSTRLILAIEKMPHSNYQQLVSQIKNTGFFPIIVPPFQAPTHVQIKQAMDLLGLKSGYKLKIPEYNIYTTNDVPIGYMYIQKLEQIGEMKIYSRSTGPVTGKTLQPTSGKRREGGQKLGEMDTYSLISYNTPILLSEMLGPLSDDHMTKNEMINDIIHHGSTKYRDAKSAPVQDLIKSYFIALMLTGR